MPSGIYPEVAFPRIVVIVQTPGLAVKEVEMGVTRPIEEAMSVVLGVERRAIEVDARGGRDRVDFVPGTDMVQALNDVRAPGGRNRFAVSAGHQHDRRAANALDLPHHLLRRDRRETIRRPCATTPITICGRRISRINDVSYVTVKGGDIREILVEVDPDRLVAAEL